MITAAPSPIGVVTTPRRAGPEVRDRARRVAAVCGLPVVSLDDARSASVALVVESAGARLELANRTVRSHPGIGLVRTRRLIKGAEGDPLLDATEIRPGDRVLDATLGYAQDALVMAWGVGSTGSVVGVEMNAMLAGLAMAGAPFWPRPAAEIMQRVELIHADSREWVRQCPSRSFDVVFFDPMFQRPRPAAPDFAILRQLAVHDALEAGDVAEARRVARRWVVVKDAWPGEELKRLGIPAIAGRRSAEIVYGRIAATSGQPGEE